MSRDGLYRRGEVWWMTYTSPDGRRHRVSTERRYHQEAKEVRDRIVGDLVSGRITAPPGKLMFEDLCQLILTDYQVKGRKSIATLKGAIACLREYFGDRKVSSIAWGDGQKYRLWRREQGYAESTINKHVAALRRMLHLAVNDGKLAAVPTLETPDPKNARGGFFERDDFETMVEKLAPAYRPVAWFAYLTGWRLRSEVLPLKWTNVDRRAGVLRLEPNTTKNDEGRTFPFDVLPELAALIRGQEKVARGPWLFHDQGERIDYEGFLAAWHAACDAAECRDRIPHDLRRTAVRHLERAGVPRSVAMQLTGHKTESVYRRYAIVAEQDLRAGVAKLAAQADVTLTSQSGVP